MTFKKKQAQWRIDRNKEIYLLWLDLRNDMTIPEASEYVGDIYCMSPAGIINIVFKKKDRPWVGDYL